jgi:hypothetical protein
LEIDLMDNNATPGMAWSAIAASAYRAYAASTGNKNFRGDPMPAWEELPPAIRTAWEAAARQVDYCGRQAPGTADLRESRWAGWTSPGT